MRLYVAGDLTIGGTTKITVSGTVPLSIVVADDTFIGPNVTFDASAVTTVPGPGGGTSGTNDAYGGLGGDNGSNPGFGGSQGPAWGAATPGQSALVGAGGNGGRGGYTTNPYPTITVANFDLESPNLTQGTYSYNTAGGSWSFAGQAGMIDRSAAWGLQSFGGITINGGPAKYQVGFVQSFGTMTQNINFPYSVNTCSHTTLEVGIQV